MRIRGPILVCLLSMAVPALAVKPAAPADLDAFWNAALSELAAHPANLLLTEVPEKSDERVKCYKADYTGYNGMALHGWYCRPAADKKIKLPALLLNPRYGEAPVEAPAGPARRGFAALAWQGRGYAVDLSSYPAGNSGYALAGIADRRAYAYRALYANALRGAEVLASLPEVDKDRIGAAGSGQGGALALAAALGGRLAAVSADFSSMCELYPGLPVTERDLALLGPGAAPARRTLAYFDLSGLAKLVKAPVKVQAAAGACGQSGVRNLFKALRVPKRLEELPAAGVSEGLRREKMLDFIYAALGAEK